MFNYGNFARTAAIACALALPTLHCEQASAGPSVDRILEKIAALEARVASLESKNREYKHELEQTRVQARSANTLRLANAGVPARGTTPVEVDHPRTEPSWSGFFWGASAGGATSRSSSGSSERIAFANPGGAPPFDLTGANTSGVSGPSSNGGGLVDLFAGWDVQVARLVLGGQVEATASDLNFSSSGTRSYAYFDSTGPTGMTATSNYRPQVTSRWMASALLRAGVLLDDRTLLYGLGGLTFAQFEARNLTDNAFYQPNETFRASGPTAGVGLERQLDSHWRVRAEYRYTKFDTAHTQDQFAFVHSAGSSQTYSRSTQFDQSMQSGRIGVAYSFNPFR